MSYAYHIQFYHYSKYFILWSTQIKSFLIYNYFLRVIVGKIDENKDGFVDMSELKNWITFTQRRYIEDDVNRQWKTHNPDNSERIHWDVSWNYSFILFLFFMKMMCTGTLNRRFEITNGMRLYLGDYISGTN